MSENEAMEKTARQWLAAREIIALFLAELEYRVRPHPYPVNDTDRANAGAIMARLAHADPPLLICTPDEMKE